MRICPVKPDRAHFCFFTGRTVLEMDHYCPWLGNCIGYGTRKPFLLSLWHGLCMGSSLFSAVAWDVVLAVTALPRAVAALALFVVLLLGLFVMAILGVFFGYHFGLAAGNYTTIENHERRLAPRTQKVPTKLDVKAAFANHDAFRDAVKRTFPSSRPAKASLFVVFWREWAPGTSPSSRDHGADLTMAGGKGAIREAPLEPVGVSVQSLTPRSALVAASAILTGRG
ncbi:hypothetical protein FNF28_01492 [Cafeteria roenbergensis]|uniref:Palmitoyltransferase n=1 Tax=Cafeteria roenbergensis TaxID=33653 RepID=A0A5A8DZC5_CAFRO|nr:hypothetical protein FNF28_01492 [Cafeteria roenbergensis]